MVERRLILIFKIDDALWHTTDIPEATRLRIINADDMIEVFMIIGFSKIICAWIADPI